MNDTEPMPITLSRIDPGLVAEMIPRGSPKITASASPETARMTV